MYHAGVPGTYLVRFWDYLRTRCKIFIGQIMKFSSSNVSTCSVEAYVLYVSKCCIPTPDLLNPQACHICVHRSAAIATLFLSPSSSGWF